MPEPLLHLGDVGLVVERVGRGRGSQRVHAEPLDVHADTHCRSVPVPYVLLGDAISALAVVLEGREVHTGLYVVVNIGVC